jgi:hypothetical protein
MSGYYIANLEVAIGITKEFLDMIIKRFLFSNAALCLVLIFFSLDCLGGQASEPSAAPGTSIELQPEAKPVDSSGEPNATAHAVAVSPVFEFEPVLDGETVTHQFIIKNTGTAELKILKVRTG